MKNNRPVYEKIFTRDFTLATVEIWVRPEVNPSKIWSKKKLPYKPYIVVEGDAGRISAYYDPRGIQWMKQELKERITSDPHFLDYLSSEYLKGYNFLKQAYSKQGVLGHKELVAFLSNAESAWKWFEACWWIWELTPEEKKEIDIPDSFLLLRENTQEIVPEIERVTRSALSHLFPDLGNLIEVLSLEEIKKGEPPSKEVLQKRHKGYFLPTIK